MTSLPRVDGNEPVSILLSETNEIDDNDKSHDTVRTLVHIENKINEKAHMKYWHELYLLTNNKFCKLTKSTQVGWHILFEPIVIYMYDNIKRFWVASKSEWNNTMYTIVLT